MGRIIVEQIVTIDGRAADPQGGLDFFDAAGDFKDTEDEQMAMIASVGAIVFGARTYRMFADYWPSVSESVWRVARPINVLPKFVVSNTMSSAPWGDQGAAAELLRGDGVEAVRGLRDRIDGDLMIWGSLTLTDALLRARAVDVLRLRSVPIVIGAGRSFVPADVGDLKWSLTKVQTYPSGHVVTEYSA